MANNTRKLKAHMFKGNDWNGVTVSRTRTHGIPGRTVFTDEQREEIREDWKRRLSDPVSQRDALAELGVSLEELHNKVDQLGHYLGCNWRTDHEWKR